MDSSIRQFLPLLSLAWPCAPTRRCPTTRSPRRRTSTRPARKASSRLLPRRIHAAHAAHVLHPRRRMDDWRQEHAGLPRPCLKSHISVVSISIASSPTPSHRRLTLRSKPVSTTPRAPCNTSAAWPRNGTSTRRASRAAATSSPAHRPPQPVQECAAWIPNCTYGNHALLPWPNFPNLLAQPVLTDSRTNWLFPFSVFLPEVGELSQQFRHLLGKIAGHHHALAQFASKSPSRRKTVFTGIADDRRVAFRRHAHVAARHLAKVQRDGRSRKGASFCHFRESASDIIIFAAANAVPQSAAGRPAAPQ